MTTPVSISKVLRAISGECKSDIIANFKASRGDLDRWSFRDIIKMCHAITMAEDKLEMSGRWAQAVIEYRNRLRSIRRELENECS